MAREKVDNKLNVVIGTKAQIEGDTSIPENSIIIVTDEELKADEIVYEDEKNVKEAIEDLDSQVKDKVDKADIVDNLTTDDATKVLSANQGKVLNDKKVDKITQEQRDSLGFMEIEDRIVSGVDSNLNEIPIKVTINKEKNTIIMRNSSGDFQDLYEHNTSQEAHSNEFNKKVDKTSIVDNVTTNDATKVLSAKQGKVLQDTKEDLTNKAVDFSVVNDTKYPTTNAVKDLVDATVGNIDAILDNILGV